MGIDSLKKGKSADSKGIKAKDLKGADEETANMIHGIFNLINQAKLHDPQFMETSCGLSDLQEGRPAKPENYGPICAMDFNKRTRECSALPSAECFVYSLAKPRRPRWKRHPT